LIYWKDRQSVFLGCNRAFAESAGVSEPAALIGKTDAEIPGLKSNMEKNRIEETTVMESGKARLHKPEKMQRKDGSPLWVDVCKIPLHNPQGGVFGVLGVLADITERRAADEQILQLLQQLEIEKNYALKNALTDSLTTLANRRSFDASISTEFYRLKRTRAPLSVVMLDIDHFKKYNDMYGHVAGDECLRNVALAVKSAVNRLPDIVARYGGEEFVIILPETGSSGALVLAEKVRKAVESLAIPHESSQTAKTVTISLGVATVDPSMISTPEQSVELADQALYTAKATGRNKVAVSESGSGEGLGFCPLVWHVSDDSGNAVIDFQHKKLFSDTNALLSALTSATDETVGRSLIRKLLDDVSAHFAAEEQILSECGFPGADRHRECHADIVERATRLTADGEGSEPDLKEAFRFIAYDVIGQHFFIEDKKFFPYV